MDYTNMNYIIYFDYASLIIMSVLVISFYMIKHLDNMQNRMLKVMLLSHFLVIGMDIINVIGPKFTMPFNYQILYGSHLCYFLLHNVTAFAFFFYCCFMVDQYGGGKRWLQIITCLPMTGIFVLVASNFWTGWIFYLDDNLRYYRGSLILVAYAVVLFYVLLSLIMISRYRERLSWLQRVVTYFYIMLCIVSAGVQYFYPKLLVECFGVTVALMILFFSTAKLADFYDEDFNVLNRHAFMEIIDSSLYWIDRRYLYVIKVHDFQLYRVTLGKDFQERLAQTVILYLQEAFPQGYVFHYTNSEFLLAFKKDFGQQEADRTLQQLNERFSGVWQIGDNQIRCAYHIGMFSWGKEEELNQAGKLKECLDYINDYSRLIDHPVLTLKDMKIGAVARNLLVQKLIQEAVDQDGFEMYYQPIYSVEENRVVSAEALIRLKNTDHGFISPEEFIPIAEQNGLIMKIGEFAFRSVCQFIQAQGLEQYGIRFIEVNLSVVQCMQERLYKQLLDIMVEYGVEPDQINLEITETAEVTQMGAFQDNVSALNQKGIGFSLDDYGTGYSNIGFLYKFPFRIIKIDKSLLWGAFENEKAMITLESSIDLAKRLNLQVVVEGVENEEHQDKLTEMGCDYLQGYYFSKPVPESEFIHYIQQQCQLDGENLKPLLN